MKDYKHSNKKYYLKKKVIYQNINGNNHLQSKWMKIKIITIMKQDFIKTIFRHYKVKKP
jgi:hypothetical protein